MLKANDGVQEFTIGSSACDPFIQEVGHFVRFGGNKLVENEAPDGCVAEVFASEAEQCGVPREVVSIKIPREAMQIPLFELVAALLHQLRPAFVIRAAE